MTDDSHISISKSATTFVGEDAIRLFQAKQLRSYIDLYRKSGIRPTRGVGPKQMLEMATQFTGKRYKRGDLEAAATDLKTWADTMALGLRVERTP